MHSDNETVNAGVSDFGGHRTGDERTLVTGVPGVPDSAAIDDGVSWHLLDTTDQMSPIGAPDSVRVVFDLEPVFGWALVSGCGVGSTQ